ncbi:hypothetical protein B0H21DRAFT_375771 [Amylocystis lapponica]|nr:hypothetical protein B0H21DRAFT_375771 [Amylocystis lapponica]
MARAGAKFCNTTQHLEFPKHPSVTKVSLRPHLRRSCCAEAGHIRTLSMTTGSDTADKVQVWEDTLVDVERQDASHRGEPAVDYQAVHGAPDYAGADEETSVEGIAVAVGGLQRMKTFHPFVKGSLLLTVIIVTTIFIVLSGVCGILYAVGKIIEGVGSGLATGPEFLWEKSYKIMKRVRERWIRRRGQITI